MIRARPCARKPPLLSRTPTRTTEGATSDPAPSNHRAPPRQDSAGHSNTHSDLGEGAHHAREGKQQRRRHNIATSRTGTGKWKRVRAQAIKQAIDSGVHNCTICGVGLDYEYSQRPSSAEVDHLLPYSKGGTDTLDNVTVICRWCNQRKGNGRNLTVPQPKTIEPGTSIEW
jgi:5-methylcytosine-specific restriction protein A